MILANRYEVLREIGRGGMGVVHLARDPLLDRDVAVKLIGSLTEDRKQRFLREARVIAKMDHPGIVGVYDLGEHEDGLFFVMPYVPGTNLRQVLSRSPLELRQFVDLGIQVAEALEYSHALGIVHRDIKPENLLVVEHSGDALRVRVTDFGLAVNATDQRMTTTGALVGTVSYLSPEQVTGGVADPRVDIYALGTVLYECVAGRTPFKGEIQSVLYRIVHEEPQPLSSLVQDLDPELEALVLSCLRKDPTLRPQHASEVTAALTRYRTKIAGSARAAAAMRTIEIRGGYAGAPIPAAPFVGRAKPIAELQARLNAAVAGDGQVVLVAGEPGIGKTRLVEEIERLAQARQIRVLSGNFNELDGATPYQGFCEMLETHVRRSSASGTGLAELEGELVALFPILGDLDASRARGPKPQPMPGHEQDRVAVFDLLARALARIAGDQPLLLVLEDLHLATVSVEALQYIARRLGSTRTLLLGTYTSTEVDRSHPLMKLIDGFKGNKRFSHVPLDRFTPEEHRSFLATVSLGTRVDDMLAAKLFEVSEGNPFFTRELFRALLDTGNITRQERGSFGLASGQLAFDAVPATVQKAVERRLERLPAELRAVLSTASVLGKSFEEHELEAIVDDDDELDDALDKLVRGGFIEEQRKGRGEQLAFTSGTMREVLYAELPRRRRRALHRKVAEHIETRHAARIERVRAQLVHHFTQADDADKVVAHGLELASAGLATFSADDAIRAARAVLGFVQDDDAKREVEVETRMLLAQAHRMAGDFDAALNELEVANKLNELVGDAARTLATHAEAAFTAWDAGRPSDAKRWLDRALKAARASGDAALLARLLSLGITVANMRGDAATARELLQEVDRLKKAEPVEVIASAGGAVRVALVAPVRVVDPAGAYIDEEVEVLANAFETLLVTDEQGNTAPALAELWQSHDGGARFTFTLRSGVRWHDGRELTAQDVKSSFERSARLGREHPSPAISAIRGVRALWDGTAEGLAGIAVSGPLDLTITLDAPLPIFPALLTDFRTAVVRDSEGGTPPIGTGPFRLATATPDRISLSRVDGHWRDKPTIEALEYHVGVASSGLAADFRAGRYDVVRDLPSRELDELLRDRRLGARSAERPKKNVCFVLLNSNSPRASEPTLRAALCRSVATSDLVWRHLGRLARPAEGLIPPGILGHDAGRRHPAIATDPLAQPVRLRAAVHPVLVDRQRPAVDALLDSWRAIGVEVDLVTTDIESFLAAMAAPDQIDVLIQRWSADYDDPDSFTYALFDSKVGTHRGLHANATLDRALTDARLETSPARRAALYRAIEDGLLAAHVILPLWHDEDCRIYGRRLHGLRLRSTPPYVDYATMRTLAPAAAEVTAGGTVTVALLLGYDNLNPRYSATYISRLVCEAMYESLTHEIKGARIVPWLAESISVEDGGKRYRVVLRNGLRFHDGRPVTARDVRYSFEHALRATNSYAPEFASPIVGAHDMIAGRRSELAGVRIVSPRELTIELGSAQASFPAVLAHETLAIIPEGTGKDARGTAREDWIGTGPFRVVRFEPSRQIELEPNPHYWRAGLPRSEGLVFTTFQTASDAVAALRQGRSSIALGLGLDAAQLLSDPDFAANSRMVPRLAVYSLLFNVQRPPFDDVRVRRAIAAALDVDELVRLLGRVAVPTRSLLPPGLIGHELRRDPPARTAPPALDLDVKLLVSPAFRKQFASVPTPLVEVLRGMGIRIELGDGIMSDTKNTEYELGLQGWVADYPDRDTFMYGLLHSTGGAWGSFVGSPALDALVNQIRLDSNSTTRDAATRDVEAMVADQALLIPLFNDRIDLFAHARLRGLTDNVVNTFGGIDFAALSVED